LSPFPDQHVHVEGSHRFLEKISKLLQVAPTVWIGYNESLIDSSTKEVSWQQFRELSFLNNLYSKLQCSTGFEERGLLEFDQGFVEIYLYMAQEI